MFCLTSAATPDPAITPQVTPLVTPIQFCFPPLGSKRFRRVLHKGDQGSGLSGGQREHQCLNSCEPRQHGSQGAKGPTESTIVEEEEALIVL